MNPSSALARFVRWVMRDVTYHQSYPATIEALHSDGTVDALPEDERMRGDGMSRIPIRAGMAETIVEPAIGARCLVAFEGGNPRRPFVAEWADLTPGVSKLAGGERRVARLGDFVEVVTLPAVTVTGVVEGTVMGAPLPPTPLIGGVATLTAPVTAQIQAGVPTVRG